MAEYASKGQTALEASDGLAAAGYFTNALIKHPTSPDYFTQRSTAFSRTKPPRHDLALRDAEYAVLLGRQRQKREKIQAGQQRRVIALYGLGRYEEAKSILESMSKWLARDNKKDKMQHDVWAAKINSKLKGKVVEDQVFQNFPEFPEIALPNEKAMSTWLQSQIKNDGSFKFEGEEDTTTAPIVSPTQSSDAKVDPVGGSGPEVSTFDNGEVNTMAEIGPEKQKTVVRQIRIDWYQDKNVVTITLYVKNVDRTKFRHEFTHNLFLADFPHPDAPESTYTYSLNPTYADIEDATVKVLGTKVEISLFKKEKGIKWPALDDKSKPPTDKLPSAWTTKGSADWDKKIADMAKKESKGKGKAVEDNAEGDVDSDADSDFGGDAVDGFFKKLYAGADEDTRRAMMKSFQESNGTALSTNWSEVGKAKVEEVRSKDD